MVILYEVYDLKLESFKVQFFKTLTLRTLESPGIAIFNCIPLFTSFYTIQKLYLLRSVKPCI